jgi:hypothetical protein
MQNGNGHSPPGMKIVSIANKIKMHRPRNPRIRVIKIEFEIKIKNTSGRTVPPPPPP